MFIASAPPDIYTLSLHDALPIYHERLAPLIDRPEMAFPILRTTDRLFEGLADTEHPQGVAALVKPRDRKSTRLNSSHEWISYAVFCLKKKSTDELLKRGRLKNYQ